MDTGEGAQVLGTRIPSPSVLWLCEPTVTGVLDVRFYDCLANDTG